MEVIRFIISYFASKNLTLLTAFVCWAPEESLQLWRQATLSGMKLRVYPERGRRWALAAGGERREGVLLAVDCPRAALVMDEASSSGAFSPRHSWLLLAASDHSDHSDHNVTIAARAHLLPDADAVWSTPHHLVDIYRIDADRPVVGLELNASRASSTLDLVQLWGRLPTAVTRRKDLDNIYIKSVILVSQPQYFRGWSDLSNKHIDTFPKMSYQLLMDCAQDLNFRYDMRQVSVYGAEHNGSFDGLVGRLQRGQAAVGASSIFMRADRWRVLDYCAETVALTGAFIFRQPAQSSVRNVFLLPFSRGVWAAAAGVGGAAALLLAATARRSLSKADVFTFTVGAVCQQGFPACPTQTPIRMVMFSTMLASVFAFTAYSAKVVVILQTPSDAIQTIDDLTRSPLALGVQETTYKRVYFAESSEPATRRLFLRRLAPLGERAYLGVEAGIARVRRGLFAFQVEVAAGYDVISKTFTESEKCDLKEIQAFRLPMVAVPLRKHCGYRELLAGRLRWQREVGLLGRARRTWLAPRPACGASARGRSVRLGDVRPALQALASGAIAAVLLLALELVVRPRGRPMREHAGRHQHNIFN